MVTLEENRRNLDSARLIAANELGLRLADDKSWSYEQRNDYITRLAEIILRYPDRFTDQTLYTARKTVDRTYVPLLDPSFSFADFAAELGNNAAAAVEAVAGVGEGVKTTLASARWLLPLAAVVAVAILLLSLAKRTAE